MAAAGIFIGLMSGTSADGVDGVAARFRRGRLETLLATTSLTHPPALRARLIAVAQAPARATLPELAELDVLVAGRFAQAASHILRKARLRPDAVIAVGSHGQTIFHRPDGRLRTSLQLGDPSRIAAASGITTVADFRRADMARGGQGAPLVPAFHAAQFARRGEARAVVNIGGIANITILPASAAEPVRGYDTGPGNALMDEWIQLHHGRAYDRAGAWASRGEVDTRLLEALSEDAYFRRRGPKSTGRDYFHLAWVRGRYPGLDRLVPQDVQRTLLELTAQTCARAAQASRPQRLFVCGGGAHNDLLMRRLGELAGVPVASTAQAGLDPKWVEASAFAWLAMQTLTGAPGNCPGVTGAKSPAVLGGVYRA